MNMSPFGPLLQLTCGNLGLPKLGPAALGVSATKSLPLQSSVSPQMWRRFSQCPISCVAERPRLKGLVAVPQGPFALNRVASFAIAVA